ncbi:MAG: hypothetical protein FWG65_13445 [Turicibacter sp.]|nr:hypothetical protein [Turicibacter sp.]
MEKNIIRNISCTLSQNSKKKPIFRFRWDWIINEEPQPALQLLHRIVDESEIMEHSLFTQDSITSYMFRGMKEHTYEAFMANGGQYDGISTYSYNSGNHIRSECDVEITQTGCLYFFYFIHQSGTIFHSFARKVAADTAVRKVSCDDEEIRISLFKREIVKKIKINKSGTKRVIMQTDLGGRKVYSLLPSDRSEYYLDSSVGNFQLMYVVDSINVQ